MKNEKHPVWKAVSDAAKKVPEFMRKRIREKAKEDAFLSNVEKKEICKKLNCKSISVSYLLGRFFIKSVGNEAVVTISGISKKEILQNIDYYLSLDTSSAREFFSSAT